MTKITTQRQNLIHNPQYQKKPTTHNDKTPTHIDKKTTHNDKNQTYDD